VTKALVRASGRVREKMENSAGNSVEKNEIVQENAK